MATTNGRPATGAADRLVRGQYADKVLASLGTQRLMTDSMLRGQIGEFNPDQVTLRDLYRMRRDPIIKMALYYTKALLSRADYSIECEDPAIRAGMQEQVDDIHSPTMRTALNMFDFGYQATVRQYDFGLIHATFEDPDSGQVRRVWDDPVVRPVVIGTPIPIPPQHATVNLKDGRFNGFNTSMVSNGQRVNTTDEPDIPAEFALWFTNEFEEEFRDYYGVSRILPAYEPWFAYWFTHHMRNRHVEQDADPSLQVWYPTGSYNDPTDRDSAGNPIKKSNRDAALEIGSQLRGGATIAWPSEVYVDEQGKGTPVRLWEADFLRGGENLGAFNEVLNALRVEKLHACLIPEEALTEALGGTGSRASASTRIDLFTQSMEMAADYMDGIWTKLIMRPAVEANWGKDAPPCKKVTTGFREEDLSLATELIKIAFNLDPNALPIKFEELLRQAGLPTYTAEEQQEREIAAAEAQQQALEEQQAQLAEAGGVPEGQEGTPEATIGAMPGESPAALAASQDGLRRGPRRYERDRIELSTVKSTAPEWARDAGARRDRNIGALSEHMHSVIRARYEAAFELAADTVAEWSDEELEAATQDQVQLSLSQGDLELGIGNVVRELVGRAANVIETGLDGFVGLIRGELASMYHITGMAELTLLGLASDSWDVGRDEVQEWARFRAGELIKTMDKTIVERHVRPWLATELQKLGIQDITGVPFGSLELAQRMSEHFEGYPEWMSERVIRSEARMGYNLSALDMWERVGVIEVEAYDGLGGKTGQTDAHCLARNGIRLSIDEARDENEKEHPNGTLGFIPIEVTADLKPLKPGILDPEPALSASIYATTDEGLVLSVLEVGEALA